MQTEEEGESVCECAPFDRKQLFFWVFWQFTLAIQFLYLGSPPKDYAQI